MGKLRAFFQLPRPLRRLYAKEETAVGRQRVTLLVFGYIPFSVMLLIAVMAGVIGPDGTFFTVTHTLLFTGYAIALLLYFRGKISAAAGLSVFTLISQAMLTVEMVYLASSPTPYHVMMVIANTVMLALNTMMSMVALLERNTLALGTATIATYVACMVISGDRHLQSFLFLFVLSFAIVAVVGLLVARTTMQLDKENIQLRRGEAELLHILRLKKNEVRAYLSLASERNSQDGTKVLLERLDKKSRHNLLTNVEEYLKTRATELDIIEKAFPEFTPSEREICRLILQGKKLGEICVVLNKNESNINSQRANMRRKLGLSTSDNLQRKLRERLDGFAG